MMVLDPWLREIPSGWDVRPLKECVLRFGTGGTPETGLEAYWAETGGTPWVAIGDMTKAARVGQTERSVTSAGLRSKRLEVFPPGTLLLSIYASIGKVAVLDIPAAVN